MTGIKTRARAVADLVDGCIVGSVELAATPGTGVYGLDLARDPRLVGQSGRVRARAKAARSKAAKQARTA